MKCTQGREISVHLSEAGYYIGCHSMDEDLGYEIPYCRISTGYYPTREKAERELREGFVLRMCKENDFCSRGLGCL